MKRSEFVKIDIGRFMAIGYGPADAATIGHANARRAEEGGIEWDPEEPGGELPQRIQMSQVVDCHGFHLIPVAPSSSWPPSDATLSGIYEAAVDAYNRLQAGELVVKSAGWPANPEGTRVVAEDFGRRIKEAMEYLDPADTVYRILNGEEP